MKLEKFELRELLTTAASLGAKTTLVAVGLLKTEISKAEAYRRYSRRTVDSWITDGAIVPVRRENKIRLNVTELDVLSETSELITKF